MKTCRDNYIYFETYMNSELVKQMKTGSDNYINFETNANTNACTLHLAPFSENSLIGKVSDNQLQSQNCYGKFVLVL